MAVTDNGIYKYSPKTATTAGIYNVDRADTFVGEKTIWQDGDKHIIVIHNKPNSTHYEWKVQLNTIENGKSTKLD